MELTRYIIALGYDTSIDTQLPNIDILGFGYIHYLHDKPITNHFQIICNVFNLTKTTKHMHSLYLYL